MIQHYYRDSRRRVQRLEDRYQPQPPVEVRILWVDDNGEIIMTAGPKRHPRSSALDTERGKRKPQRRS